MVFNQGEIARSQQLQPTSRAGGVPTAANSFYRPTWTGDLQGGIADLGRLHHHLLGVIYDLLGLKRRRTGIRGLTPHSSAIYQLHDTPAAQSLAWLTGRAGPAPCRGNCGLLGSPDPPECVLI